jgi:membrane protease YdiL (CAAX protease family)
MFLSIVLFQRIISLFSLSDSLVSSIISTFTGMSLPMLLFLALLPVSIKLFIEKKSLYNLAFVSRYWRSSLLVSLAIIMGTAIAVAISVVQSGSSGIQIIPLAVHFFLLSIAEEVFVRSALFDECRRMFNGLMICIITGIIFAFALHSASDMLVNLVVRFPFGFIASYIRYKTGCVYIPIALHYCYDSIILLIEW